MPYSAEIGRRHPSCFLFLVDRSASMADGIVGPDGQEVQKAIAVADAVNRLLDSLGQRCVKGNEIYDYFDVGAIGYSNEAVSLFEGVLAGRAIAPISDVYENPARLERRVQHIADGMGGTVEVANDFPVWFAPAAEGGTAMCAALDLAGRLLTQWVTEHPYSYPPTVINITDGEATDGDPTEAAHYLRSLHTLDGAALLYNVHISADSPRSIAFPQTPEDLDDPYARLMFELSSPLPEPARLAAEKEGYRVGPQARAFMFNADPVKLIQFLDIGTRAHNLR